MKIEYKLEEYKNIDIEELRDIANKRNLEKQKRSDVDEE